MWGICICERSRRSLEGVECELLGHHQAAAKSQPGGGGLLPLHRAGGLLAWCGGAGGEGQQELPVAAGGGCDGPRRRSLNSENQSRDFCLVFALYCFHLYQSV